MICPNPECPRDGKPFSPTRKHQVWCSKRCREQGHFAKKRQRVLERIRDVIEEELGPIANDEG